VIAEAAWALAEPPLAASWWAYTRIIEITAGIRVEGEEPAGAAIFVNFHHHQPLMNLVHQHRGRWMMVSRAPALRPIARFCNWLGIRTARGSSAGGGRAALRELKDALARGESVIIAVDGPAGPAFKVKRGCVELAQECGVPIVPVAYSCARGFALPRRWDRALFATPFDRVVVRFGPAIDVSADSPENGAARVERALRKIS
jgi:lysophospholipid acyltransferase (LPLAT)-like uncharacterized protein